MVPAPGRWAMRSALILAAFALCCWLPELPNPGWNQHLWGANDVPGILELARRVAAADPQAEALLSAVGSESRGSEWQRLHVLASLAAGADAEALLLAERLAAQDVAAGWSLQLFCAVHARTRTPDFRPPVALRGNPALEVEAELWRWAAGRLHKPAYEPVGVFEVHLFGAELRSADLARIEDPTTRRAETRRLLEDGRREVLERLTRGQPVGAQVAGDGGRWVLVTYLRHPEDLQAYATQVRRLSELLLPATGEPAPEATLRALCVFNGRYGAATRASPVRAEWLRELDRSRFPVVLAYSTAVENFLTPGFERGNVTVLVDPRRNVRMVSGQAIPLPVLHARCAALLASEH